MASFNVSEYVNYVENKDNNSQNRVGFFKLNIGESALVRFNISNLNDIYGAFVHTYSTGNGKFETSSCLGKEQGCPICIKGIFPSRRAFIQLLVSYIDKKTNEKSECQSVIWSRSMSFVQMINKKLEDLGDLRNIVFRVDRIDKNTYNVEYIIQKPEFDELLPRDFSSFEGYSYEGRAFRKKTLEELKDIAAMLTPETKDNSSQKKTERKEDLVDEFQKPIENSIKYNTLENNTWSF